VPWQPRVVEVIGRFAEASNATLLAETTDGERVIYKPIAGEQPLWDFPRKTLAIREVLTYEISVAMGLDVVPETVLAGGPYGPGAIQRFVETDPDFDAVALVRRGDDRLWPVTVLDLATNNADRKLGHLLGSASALRAIDHGLTLHPEDKLRTVLWVFAGEPIPDPLVAGLIRLGGALDAELGRRVKSELGRGEFRALQQRTSRVIEDPVHPYPPTDRPPIPWPPY